ncbi:MAG: hypothetical protein M3Y17_07095 [Actinomycetota bacterium]|nr:hypothetical protein [Actinomycetota bacterium]
MKYEIAQWRASWGVMGSMRAFVHALLARARIVEAKNASVAVRPEHEVGAVSLGPLPVGHQLTVDNEGHRDGAAPGAGLDIDRALDRIPRALDADDACVEVDVDPLESAELPTAEAAEERDRPERSFAVGEGGEQLVRDLGRLDPISAAADGGEVEILGRVESDLIAPDRSPIDHPERVEDVGDRRWGESLAAPSPSCDLQLRAWRVRMPVAMRATDAKP